MFMDTLALILYIQPQTVAGSSNSEDIPNGLVAGKAKDRFRGRGTLSDGRMVMANFLEENHSKLSQIKCIKATFER